LQVRLYGEKHSAFLAAHPTPLEVPAPNFQAPIDFFDRFVADKAYGDKPQALKPQRL
jgi:hypothetical protein